ncbi:hypothetical protein A499_18414 [Niallia nealsonii AAU1]|nr:hypothetical protein A499_18414 [Niallia nealsonii AAU1]
MELTGLKNLYKSMKEQSIIRYKFDFKYNNFKFSVIYFIDEVPNKLAFGIKDHNFYFEVSVNNFFVKNFIENLNEFCRIMGFSYNSKNKFHPSFFFEEFNKHIPNHALKTNVPKPSEIATFRSDIEESDKVYFIGWKNHTVRSVSLENLDKTRKLLSFQAYNMCKRKNISSCWSMLPSDEIEFYLP